MFLHSGGTPSVGRLKRNVYRWSRLCLKPNRISQFREVTFEEKWWGSRLLPGRQIDLAILGAFEVTDKGDVANWMIPGKMVKGPGGAMDLVAGVKRVVAVMEHTSKDGSPKILKECTLPITGLGVVNLIFTDLCVFEVKQGGGLVLTELHPGVTEDDIRAKTGAPFEVALKT
jgi:3-oxoacid CoA-transferase